MVIKAISHSVLEVGKLVKKSKKRFVWKFMIDGYEHVVELRVSHISSKRKVIYNNDVIYEGKKKMNSSFQFPFQIDVNMCTILEKGENYDLKINNQSFDQLEGGEHFRQSNFNLDQAPVSNQRVDTFEENRRPSINFSSYPSEPTQPTQPSQPVKAKKEKAVEYIDNRPPQKVQKAQKAEVKEVKETKESKEGKSGFGFFKSKNKDSKSQKEIPEPAQVNTQEEKTSHQPYRAPFQLNLDSGAASALRGVRHIKANQENDSGSVNQAMNKNPAVNYTPSPIYQFTSKQTQQQEEEDNYTYSNYGNNW